MRVIVPVVLLLPFLMIGCSDERQLRQWQQQQVEQLQEQALQNAEAARTLVEADTKARQELVALQHDLQTDQHELAHQRDSLDADRKEVAQARERVPLLATAFQGMAGLLLSGAALAVCVYLLRGLSKETGAEELEDFLVLEVAGESQLLAPPPMASLPPTNSAPMLPHHPNDDSDDRLDSTRFE